MSYFPNIPDETGFYTCKPAHEILAGLWVGSTPNNIRDYKTVFSMSAQGSYHVEIGQRVITAPIDDSNTREIPVAIIEEISDMVIEAMKRGKTLVHCSAGLNRSPLVVALVMIKLGSTPQDAIDHIRKVRDPWCLHTKAFELWLLDRK